MEPENPFPDDPAQERALAFDFAEPAPDQFTSRVIPSGLLRLYGGLVAAQALAAAQRTVPSDKSVHSLHAYFLKPGLIDRPLDLSVHRLTDGRSFAARRISVTQGGNPVLEMMASFQAGETGREHAFAMPEVPPPDDLPMLEELFAAERHNLPDRHQPYWLRRQQLEWRPCEPFRFGRSDVQAPRRNFWFRMKEPLAAAEDEHRRWLVYASDFHIFQTGLLPLGLGWDSNYLQTSSLDHAIWFHATVDMNAWMLYALETPAASGARTLSRGSIYRADGTLVATVTQQGLLRELAEEREGKI